ncbi:leucine--tRNA ligase [Candidatus Bandiella euplotis]|uniref:Leucine--tRNA ligase n=1 Tax=Candidatus Bandiella euplotis TaxID=1664265 RepID=A0ABZ0UL02_9RICK|nr:leucine--tRNA ligase [Candidatus Bandiella woodruffii]WPX96791.1 Leucine--tRNA ligase [Candidatus Bandiella woodruffii]
MEQTKYDHVKIEKKWQDFWDVSCTYQTNNNDLREKYYVLEMFLYPSGKIHMGHVRNYAIGDTLARFKKAQGFNVLHPMGWDAFGLPAENAAIQHNLHPDDWTMENVTEMKKQLRSLGFSYDWSREINTSKPEYYKHEQAMFIDFLQKGLAYQKESIVNWDPVDCTVLANEQVVDGKGWRSGAEIQKKKLKQWFLKITDYKGELLRDLDNLPNWPDNVKLMQRNWIGKSKGALINFEVVGIKEKICVFSTRPETIFGATFVCIAYDHKFAKHIKPSDEKTKFIENCKKVSESGELNPDIGKEGWFTGHYVAHPFLKDKLLPIYIANYVLSDYGSGAVFGCPAHDERDFEFAQQYNLEILEVIKPLADADTKTPYTDSSGILVNSEFLNGLQVLDAAKEAIKRFESLGIGQEETTYRLKDWGVSRQRYWGCPIPVIYCKSCGTIPVDKEHLPVELPKEVSFDGYGNPLDAHPTWKHVKCHRCGKDATRETDTFDTFFESSWYFARFCSLETDRAFDKKVAQKWLPVDQYIGGIEHAIMHLLYARFFTKALRDCGYLDIDEPFTGLLTQGMICHRTFKDSQGKWLSPDQVVQKGDKWLTKEGNEDVLAGRIEKMSKSKKNIIDPSDIIAKYGADSMRLFVLSDSPPTRDLEWSDEGIEGSYKYISSIYKFVLGFIKEGKKVENPSLEEELKLKKFAHQTIAAVTADIEDFALNKAIANIRKLSNKLFASNVSFELTKEVIEMLLKLISAFTPHLAAELWEKIGHKQSLHEQSWPIADAGLLDNETAKVAVQINGKTRALIELPYDCSEEHALALVNDTESLNKYLSGVQVKKLIYVSNKIINFVV